ncbi:hypothetical protein FGADI_10317 [Fusarium gaditjirri]|uniref:Uncharacterized protein n=1 Tax=Fusarium gaditjirri TaxID=282569 RepID=A0A8H4SXL3_9HYPO|nr:hypothetical protein FGADI_10317 [Fusarium gaditjirri]
MNEERREHIAIALRQYRETVLQHNLFLLRALVEKIEAQPAPPNCSEALAQSLRMQAIQELIEVPESIEETRDVFDDSVISSLISSASLEGVDDDPVDPSLRREYFAGVKAGIIERGVEVAEFPPSDLEYLCTLVSGITGPGLPFHREVSQFDFVTPLQRGKMKAMIEAVGVSSWNDTREGEHNQLTWLWEDWEISIAFKIGGGPRAWAAHMLYTAATRTTRSGSGDMEFMMKSGIAMSMKMWRNSLPSMLISMSKARKSSRMM